MKRLALLVIVGGLSSVLYAQEKAQPTPRPTPPSGPLLNRAPKFARWIVTSEATPSSSPAPTASPQASVEPSPTPTAMRHHKKSADLPHPKLTGSPFSSPAAQATPRKTTVVKTGDTRYEETVIGEGPKIQRWWVSGIQVTVEGSVAPVVSLPGIAENSEYTDYSKTDFIGFEWVNQKNFTGVEKVEDQECFVFKSVLQPPAGSPCEVAAYINSATRLPVELRQGDEIAVYAFGVAPTAFIALPPEVQTVIDNWRKTMNQSALMPAKP